MSSLLYIVLDFFNKYRNSYRKFWAVIKFSLQVSCQVFPKTSRNTTLLCHSSIIVDIKGCS